MNLIRDVKVQRLQLLRCPHGDVGAGGYGERGWRWGIQWTGVCEHIKAGRLASFGPRSSSEEQQQSFIQFSSRPQHKQQIQASTFKLAHQHKLSILPIYPTFLYATNMSDAPKILVVLTSHGKLGDTGKPTGWYLVNLPPFPPLPPAPSSLAH